MLIMNKNQIRFARTLTATWKVLRDPVLTAIYMKKWKRCKDITLTIYGYVFREMYRAAWLDIGYWWLAMGYWWLADNW